MDTNHHLPPSLSLPAYHHGSNGSSGPPTGKTVLNGSTMRSLTMPRSSTLNMVSENGLMLVDSRSQRQLSMQEARVADMAAAGMGMAAAAAAPGAPADGANGAADGDGADAPGANVAPLAMRAWSDMGLAGNRLDTASPGVASDASAAYLHGDSFPKTASPRPSGRPP
eukprot:316649-Chlamydomonas_euryale.AAC.1